MPDMRRRDVIAILGGAAAWPLAALGQQPERMWRIGYLRAAPPPERNLQAFLRALAEKGGIADLSERLVQTNSVENAE
jgi:putative ABC transport system substrate-binding protein